MTTTLNPTKAGQRADTKHVEMLISNYKKERWLTNTKNLGKPDSLSTWFGLESLATFLELARENQADGIKMYYGVYPKDYDNVPAFQGRQTVVLVATRKKSSNGRIFNKDIYISTAGQSEILAFNFGDLCPPYCGSGTPPDSDVPFGIDMEKTGLSIIDGEDGIMII